MSAESRALGVVGDNIANMNTTGFKQSRAIFENVLGDAVGTRNAIGSGVRMSRTQQIFAQGTLLSTGQATDLAMSGDGFFIVNGNVDGVHGDFYTRAGELSVRNDGVLVNPAGLTVRGFAGRADGTFASTLSDLQVPVSSLPPRATTKLNFVANLSSSSTTPSAAFSLADPGNTSNHTTSMTVYDSLGNARAVNVYYRMTGPNQWSYYALTDGANTATGTAGTNVQIATGTLTFNTSGALQSATGTGSTVDFRGAAPGQALTFNFGTPIAGGGTGRDGLTQFASASNDTAQSQDGYASADLTGVNIDNSGIVSSVFANGQTLAIGQVAVARFRANDGLARAGQNLWVATRDSGEASIGAAGSSGRGAVVSGSLEQSNVDVTEQFVEMISRQRSFQANSKTISTADQMLQELMNIKQ